MSAVKLKTITASLRAPSAGAACSEAALTEPTTLPPRSLPVTSTVASPGASAGILVGSTLSSPSPVSSCQRVSEEPPSK